jgi:hypothetical protein
MRKACHSHTQAGRRLPCRKFGRKREGERSPEDYRRDSWRRDDSDFLDLPGVIVLPLFTNQHPYLHLAGSGYKSQIHLVPSTQTPVHPFFSESYRRMLGENSFSPDVGRTRSVWIFARPLSVAKLFSLFEYVSYGKFPLSHWGVLVTQRRVDDLKAVLVNGDTQRFGERSTADSDELGIVWELNRIEGDVNTVNVTRPFTFATLKFNWTRFSAMYLGSTEKDDIEIQSHGI